MGQERRGPRRAKRPMAEIRETNEGAILEAAETVFAARGYSGATMAEIARAAGLPKANVHYYFGTKDDLFRRVLENILDLWLASADAITEDANPAQALGTYIRAKIEYSRTRPSASKVFAGEILHGAPHLLAYLRRDLRRRVAAKAKVIDAWVARGLMEPVPPEHLFFVIWAATQTYADFDSQVMAVLGQRALRREDYDAAAALITRMVLRGCGIKDGGDGPGPATLV